NWVYMFNYEWVEQHIVKDTNGKQYGIRAADVMTTADLTRNRLVADQILAASGNLIWLGDEAKQRLTLESPILASIAHPLPIKSETNLESLVFVLKFDELIPRLQKYYGLDDKRKAIQEYEISPETARYLAIVNLQIEQCKHSEFA